MFDRIDPTQIQYKIFETSICETIITSCLSTLSFKYSPNAFKKCLDSWNNFVIKKPHINKIFN